MQYPQPNSDALHRGSIPPGSPWRGHQMPIDANGGGQGGQSGLNSGAALKLPSLPKLGGHNYQPANVNNPRGHNEPTFAQMVQGHPNSGNVPASPSTKALNSRGTTAKYNRTESPESLGQNAYPSSGPIGGTNPRDSGAQILGSVNAQMMPKVNTSYGMSSLNTVLPGMSNGKTSVATGTQSKSQQLANGSASDHIPKVQNLSLQDRQVSGSSHVQPQKQDPERYGLRSLLDNMEAMDKENQNVVLGSDMTQSGLNLRAAGEKLSHTFASPWQETSKHPVIPDFKLPACYNIDTVVPQQQKLQNFDEGALFYIFYTMPRDAMQEAAAVELTNRSWRYHKELKMWLTKDPLSEPIQTNNQEESGIYIFFDPTSWKKLKREYILYYPDIA